MPSPPPHRVAIVGGGPAGLMAAETLARADVQVTVYDQRRSMARKFVLAGRSGLNLTTSDDGERLLDRYGDRRAELAEPLRRFGPAELRAWSAALGEPTFVGTSGRVFPESLRATPLLRAWIRRLADLGVRFEPGHRWLGWGLRGETGETEEPSGDGAVVLRFATGLGEPDAHEIAVPADAVVFALGGASWPRVGGDGSWVERFREAAVDVVALRSANAGVRIPWTEIFADRFAGTPLKNVAVATGGDRVRGDIVVTTTGMEGGPVYALGGEIRTALEGGGAAIAIDLTPDLDHDRLSARLAERRRAKDSLSTWLRKAGFDPVAVGVMREATRNRLPETATALAGLAKSVVIPVENLMPLDRAISTAGGVAFDEIDESFMVSRLPGVFAAGEMLDWDAPTGGYLLQACFSTGVAAATGVLEWLGRAGP